MSDETTKKPSADEILDELAVEMGVEDDETSTDVETSNESEDETTSEESADAEKGELDDDSSVKTEPKKKEKKPAAKKKAEAKKEPASTNSDVESVLSLFRPGSDDDDIDIDSLPDPYAEEHDAPPANPVNKALIGVIVLLVLGGGGVVLATTSLGNDLVLLAKGTYQEEKAREARRLEREHLEAQLAAMPRYGNLIISGRPQHATIRLNGQIPYGQTSDGQWRALTVGPTTAIQDLSIDTVYEVEVEAPGHEPRTFTVTSEMWQPQANDYLYEISATLTPLDSEAFEEFTARMDGVEDKFYTGTVNFTTNPPGAQIKVNNRVAMNEEGEELRTPISVAEYWLKDEESGELKKYDFRVDMPPNRGNRIELIHPDEEGLPQLVMALQRSMWECQWKDEAEQRRLPNNASILDKCNYVYDLDFDFKSLQNFIAEREAERERVESQSAQAAETDNTEG